MWRKLSFELKAFIVIWAMLLGIALHHRLTHDPDVCEDLGADEIHEIRN